MRYLTILILLFFSLLTFGKTNLAPPPTESVDEEVLFSIYGNSISTYKGYIPSDYLCWFSKEQMKVEETWWYQVGDAMQWKLCNNSSWSGSRVAYDKDWDYNSYFISPYRIQNLSENGDPNHILVLGGVNDWRWSLSELGIVDDSDSTSFCGAYNLMLSRLQLYHPQSRIYCISILPIAEGGNDIYSLNSKGWNISQANECIKEICQKKGISFIDMSPCSFCEDVSIYTADGLHPNVQGMRLIADYISMKLKELNETTTIKKTTIKNLSNGWKFYSINGFPVKMSAKKIIIKQDNNGIFSKVISK